MHLWMRRLLGHGFFDDLANEKDYCTATRITDNTIQNDCSSHFSKTNQSLRAFSVHPAQLQDRTRVPHGNPATLAPSFIHPKGNDAV